MDKKQKQEISAIYQDPKFQSVIDFGESFLKKLDRTTGVGDTEYETVKKSIEREAKINGLMEFFHALYQIAYDPEVKTEEIKEERLTE